MSAFIEFRLELQIGRTGKSACNGAVSRSCPLFGDARGLAFNFHRLLWEHTGEEAALEVEYNGVIMECHDSGFCQTEPLGQQGCDAGGFVIVPGRYWRFPSTDSLTLTACVSSIPQEKVISRISASFRWTLQNHMLCLVSDRHPKTFETVCKPGVDVNTGQKR